MRFIVKSHDMTHLQDVIVNNSNLSVKIAGLRVAVEDIRSMRLVTKYLQLAEGHLEDEIGTRANFVTDIRLHVNTILSCRIMHGIVDFGIYQEHEKKLTRQIEDKDINSNTFEKVLERIIIRCTQYADRLENGERIPQDGEILQSWSELDKQHEEHKGSGIIQPHPPRLESLDEQIAKARAQLEAERTEQGAALNKNNNMGIGIGDD